LERNKRNRRTFVTAAAILAVALIGLYAVNVGDASADKTVGAISSDGAGLEKSGERAAASLSTGDAVRSIIKMASALVIVIFCVYLGVFFLKKLMERRYGGRSNENLLQVLESAYVGPKKMVSLVRVADKSVLIGVTDEHISVLTELGPEKTAEIVSTEEVREEQVNFRDFLRTATGKIRGFRVKRSDIIPDN
jgi:flagellar protein FliO/FliZ